MREPSMPATHVDPRPRPRPRPRARARARDRDFGRGPRSPACSRIATLQVLHLGKNVAEMLAVLAALAMPGMRPIFGTPKRRLGQYLVDSPDPICLNVGQSGRDALIRHHPIQLIL